MLRVPDKKEVAHMKENVLRNGSDIDKTKKKEQGGVD